MRIGEQHTQIGTQATATVILLNGRPTIRLTENGYLLGYYSSVDEMAAHVDMSKVK